MRDRRRHIHTAVAHDLAGPARRSVGWCQISADHEATAWGQLSTARSAERKDLHQ